MDREAAHVDRGIVLRAVVRATNDNGPTQTGDVTVLADVDRSGVEVLQPFGFASRPRAGSLAVVLAVGADQGDLVMLPISDPADRFGGLEEGEACLYTADGSRFHLKADGTADLQMRKALEATIAGTGKFRMDGESVRWEVPGHVLEMGPNGLRHNGKNIGADHVHGQVTPGPADTGPPAN